MDSGKGLANNKRTLPTRPGFYPEMTTLLYWLLPFGTILLLLYYDRYVYMSMFIYDLGQDDSPLSSLSNDEKP